MDVSGLDTVHRETELFTASISDRVSAEQAVQFLKEQGHSLHPALDATHQNGQEPMQNPSDGAFRNNLTRLYTDEFRAAIEAYRTSSDDPKLVALKLNNKVSWEEVIQVAREAEEVYVKGGEKWLRKVGRRVSVGAPGMLPVVRCIPNDMGLAVLSGGLELIIEESAAAKIGEKRQDVLKALLKIPLIVVEADECCEHFGPDPVLSAHAENLFCAALAAIEGTIKWLVSSSNRKPIHAVWRGPLYNKSFESKMNALNEAMVTLQSRTSSLRDRSIKNIDQSVQNVQNIAENVARTQEEVRVEVHESETRQARRLEQVSKDAIEEMKKVLADTNKTGKWMEKKDREIRRLRLRIHQVENAAAALTEEDIFEIMDVGRDHPNVDLRKLLRNNVQDSDPSGSNAALNIVKSPSFLMWKTEDESDALFVEVSRQHMSLSRHISAASLMSSSFIQSLEGNPEATIVYFFCGQHTSAADKLRGPQGMMRSMICQLLRWHPYPQLRIDFVTVRLRQLLESLNGRALLECFSKLVKQLPLSATLFCIIDNINFFTTREWLEDCQDVIDMLRDLVDDSELQAVLKLLVTSTGRTRHFTNTFQPERHLVINNDVPDGRSRLTERQISSASKRSGARQQNHVLTALRVQDLEQKNCEVDDSWD